MPQIMELFGFIGLFLILFAGIKWYQEHVRIVDIDTIKEKDECHPEQVNSESKQKEI